MPSAQSAAWSLVAACKILTAGWSELGWDLYAAPTSAYTDQPCSRATPNDDNAIAGAGAVLSVGLARANTYRGMEDRVLSQRWYTSGDSLFTESIFTHMGILPTNPGACCFLPFSA